MTGLLDEGRAVDVLYPDLGKHSVLHHNILLDKLMKNKQCKWTQDCELAELAQKIDQQHEGQLEASHYGSTLGINTGTKPAPSFIND